MDSSTECSSTRNIIKESANFSLSPDLAIVASAELNETPANRRQCLVEMKERLQEINCEDSLLDEEFLVRFLRCKKFDVARAISVFEGYHAFRRDNPCIFTDLSPSNVRHIWDSGVIGALPHRDRKGRAVMVAFPGRWDPENHSLEDMMKAMVLQLEYLISTVETQINGIVLIADFTGFTFHQARSIRPWYFQVLSSLVQNAFPARFKGVFILNQPWYISFMMSIISRLLSDKMKSRIHMLGEEKALLNESFDQNLLPAELGGSSESGYNSSEWTDTMLSYTYTQHTTLTRSSI